MHHDSKVISITLCLLEDQCEFKQVRKPGSASKRRYPMCKMDGHCSHKIECPRDEVKFWGFEHIKQERLRKISQPFFLSHYTNKAHNGVKK